MSSVAQQLFTSPRFEASRQQFEQLVEELGSPQRQRMQHSETEEWLFEQGQELLRQMYQDWLEQLGTGHVGPAVVGSDGVTRKVNRRHGRNLESLFGTVRLERMAYSAKGEQSLHPLDKRLNLPVEKYSHALRRHVAIEAACGSFEAAIERIERYTGAHICKRQAEELCQRAAIDFEEFYEHRRARARQEGGTQGPELLVLTNDGKCVPMLREGLRAQTRRAADREERPAGPPHKPSRRRRHGKREACVAAVCAAERYRRTAKDVLEELWRQGETPPGRPTPQDKVVWASLERSRKDVIGEMFDEAEARDPQHHKTWVVLVDALAHPIRLIRAEAKKRGIELTLIVDLIHVLSYLWAAAGALFGRSSEQAERAVRRWLGLLLEGQLDEVVASMRRGIGMNDLPTGRLRKVRKSVGYLLENQDMMRYDEYILAGYPIATGVIEGACRYLVKDRLELTGARWGLPGAESVLRLRAMWLNGDFDEYWSFHLDKEYEENHASRYASSSKAAELPSSNPPHLKLLQ